MKTEEIARKCKIVDLLEECLAKGVQLVISKQIRFGKFEKPEWVEVSAHGVGNGLTSREGLLKGLRFVVDQIRAEREEPSLDVETESFIAEDTRHADAPPVEIGPNACCSFCGSQKPLQLHRKLAFDVSWQSGQMNVVPFRAGIFPEPGEIGACQDCGKFYTFAP